MRTFPGEPWARRPRRAEPCRPGRIVAAMAGLAVPLRLGRLRCRRPPRARQRPQPATSAKACHLAADVSFERMREHLGELLGDRLASETLRVHCERHPARTARWQGQETSSAADFRKARGVGC